MGLAQGHAVRVTRWQKIDAIETWLNLSLASIAIASLGLRQSRRKVYLKTEKTN